MLITVPLEVVSLLQGIMTKTIVFLLNTENVLNIADVPSIPIFQMVLSRKHIICKVLVVALGKR